ncbi:MAG: glycine cleavage system protein GcvH, partial [Bacteroidaceae bacterium]
YTKEHEWIRVDGDVAYVGITDYAQNQLGDIVFVDIPTEGDTVDAEEVFGSIEVVKTVSDLFMPVTGKVLEINSAIDADPSLVNSDPYGAGWIIKITLLDPSQMNHLLDVAAYRAIINE